MPSLTGSGSELSEVLFSFMPETGMGTVLQPEGGVMVKWAVGHIAGKVSDELLSYLDLVSEDRRPSCVLCDEVYMERGRGIRTYPCRCATRKLRKDIPAAIDG